MGLLKEDPIAHTAAIQKKHIQELGLDSSLIEEMIRERNEARQKKDWARGDAIRDELLGKGIEASAAFVDVTGLVVGGFFPDGLGISCMGRQVMHEEVDPVAP